MSKNNRYLIILLIAFAGIVIWYRYETNNLQKRLEEVNRKIEVSDSLYTARMKKRDEEYRKRTDSLKALILKIKSN
jgi:hypothetical protein